MPGSSGGHGGPTCSTAIASGEGSGEWRLWAFSFFPKATDLSIVTEAEPDAVAELNDRPASARPSPTRTSSPTAVAMTARIRRSASGMSVRRRQRPSLAWTARDDEFPSPGRSLPARAHLQKEESPMSSLMVDFIISLDAYGAAEGWPGLWGMEGPEYLRLARGRRRN
jgi:hypothetical protein